LDLPPKTENAGVETRECKLPLGELTTLLQTPFLNHGIKQGDKEIGKHSVGKKMVEGT